MFGFGKYGWFAALSASARNSMFLPSAMRVCLISARSTLFCRGPRRVAKRNGQVRTWLPSNCLAEAVSKLATLNQCSGRALIERQLDVGRVAVVDHVAPGQREAALDAPDAGDFPAADDAGNEPVGAGQQARPLPNGSAQTPLMLMRCGASASEISRTGAGSEAFSRLTACIHFWNV